LKNFSCLLLFVFAFFWGCSATTVEPEVVQEVPFSELAGYKMKILPMAPMAGNAVTLVVYEDCGYNRLTLVQRNGTIIEIEKQFNSRMMLPCMLRNDTIQLGALPMGTYLVVYKLQDVAIANKPKTTFSLSFRFPVL